MQFVSVTLRSGRLEIDVDLSSQEITDFMHRHDGSIRREFPSVEFFHPINHPVKNRLRVIVGGQVQPNESTEAAGQRVYDRLAAVMRGA